MVLASVSNGTILTDGTLQTITTDGGENLAYHMIKVFCDAMVLNDTIVITIYDWDIVSGTYKIMKTLTLYNTITDIAFYAPPLPTHRFQVKIQQTSTGSGGYKNFNWERLKN